MKKKRNTVQLILIFFMVLIALVSLLPFWMLISASLTGSEELYQSGYSLLPKILSFESYQYVLKMKDSLIHAYFVSIFVTVSGTAISLIMTSMMAYPLSNPKFRRRNLFSFIVFFTMLFNGGLVPTYLMYTQVYHIKNTIWAQIIPGMLLSAMNVMLVRNYFATSIPYELNEAAKIDGASEIGVYFKIMLPLSKPIMAAIGLMTALGYWNNWTNGYYYISDVKLKSYQNILDNILKQIQYLSTMADSSTAAEVIDSVPSISVRMTLAVIGALPILIVYPFFEKYFEKGLTIGAVKG